MKLMSCGHCGTAYIEPPLDPEGRLTCQHCGTNVVGFIVDLSAVPPHIHDAPKTAPKAKTTRPH